MESAKNAAKRGHPEERTAPNEKAAGTSEEEPAASQSKPRMD
jgi:hypothetical protein